MAVEVAAVVVMVVLAVEVAAAEWQAVQRSNLNAPAGAAEDRGSQMKDSGSPSQGCFLAFPAHHLHRPGAIA